MNKVNEIVRKNTNPFYFCVDCGMAPGGCCMGEVVQDYEVQWDLVFKAAEREGIPFADVLAAARSEGGPFTWDAGYHLQELIGGDASVGKPETNAPHGAVWLRGHKLALGCTGFPVREIPVPTPEGPM